MWITYAFTGENPSTVRALGPGAAVAEAKPALEMTALAWAGVIVETTVLAEATAATEPERAS